MEKTKKKYFVLKFKDAIFNFDEYRNFLEEKLSASIKYFLKLMLVFSLILSIAINIKAYNIFKDLVKNFKEQAPEFSFVDNQLVVQKENKKYITGYEKTFGIIVNSEISDIEEINETMDYTNCIVFLKDKVVIKGDSINKLVQSSTTYEEISQNMDLSKLNKKTVEDGLESNKMQNFLIYLAFLFFIVYFVVSFIEIFIDVLLLFLLGYLVSRILGMRIKNSNLFNICIYAITLPVVLLLISTLVNIYTDFKIVYFDIAYRSISYIYLITALLIIKSDLIKQNMELTRIIQVQKQVQNDPEEEPEEEEEEEKEPEDKTKKDNKKKEDESGKEPQGNQA